MGVDAPVIASVAAYLALPAPQQVASLAALHAASPADAAGPFFRAVSSAPQAFEFLSSVRSLCCAPPGSGEEPPWAGALDAGALAALRPLYGPSQTPLQQLLPGSPEPWMAALVESARSGERVRPTADAAEFARKFGWRRMVFGLHHAAQPRELLAALYAALLPAMPPSIAALDAQSGGAGPGDPSPPPPGAAPWTLCRLGTEQQAAARPPTTAAFYSVGSPAPLARGLRLGTRIIYALADTLARSPHLAAQPLTTFCTLSPVPGFVPWLRGAAAALGGGGGGGSPREVAQSLEGALQACVAAGQQQRQQLAGCSRPPPGQWPSLLPPLLTPHIASVLQRPRWWTEAGGPPGGAGQLGLQRALAATALEFYLLRARSPSARGEGGGGPLCKVAAFHLANGARMGRLCGGADPTPEGLKRSGGFMVNYIYSDSGVDGLKATQGVFAPEYHRDPSAVLDRQRPPVVWGG